MKTNREKSGWPIREIGYYFENLEQVDDPSNPEVCADVYDPCTDPLFRTVLGWSQRNQDALKSFVLAPVSPVAMLIYERHGTRPSQARYLSFKPHKDPSLLLVLSTKFRLAQVKIMEGDKEEKALEFPFKSEQEWLLLHHESITVSELVNASKNIVAFLPARTLKFRAVGQFTKIEPWWKTKSSKNGHS